MRAQFLLFTVYKNIMLAYLELCEYQKSYEYLQKVKQEMEKNSDAGMTFRFSMNMQQNITLK